MRKGKQWKALAAAAITAFTVAAVFGSTRLFSEVSYVEAADESLPTEEGQLIVVMNDTISNKKAAQLADSLDAECVDTAKLGDSATVAIMEVSQSQSVEDAIEMAESNPDVAYAQPNYKYELDTTNDTYSGATGTMSQWYLSFIKAEEAWSIIDGLRTTKDIEPVRVAVLDTGVDIDHEDLQTALNKSLCVATDGMDGFTAMKSDEVGHGTHVAGIIAGTAGNGKGIAGVASGGSAEKNLVNLMVVGVNSPEDPESFSTYTLLNGINYAVKNGAKIMNMSLGGYGKDTLLADAVSAAYDEGVLCVCAAGNSGLSEYLAPSDYGETLSVMNITQSGKMHYSSDYGIEKDISAPGTIIMSTLPNSEYGTNTGTSMAAPMVTAVAAMVEAVNPDLTPEQVRNIICGTAKDIYAEGYDEQSGYGIVQADQAVLAAIKASDSSGVSSISIKKSSVTLNMEQTEKLQTLVLPATTTSQIVWKSSNSNIVSVDSSGRVTGVKTGEATVTATVGGKSASCIVTVNGAPAPTSVEFFGNKTERMAVGDTFEFSAKVLPSNACDRTVSWSSSNQKVATVDDEGVVTAKGVGTVTITAESYNHKQAECTIKVGPAAQKISFSKWTEKLRVGKTYQFGVTVTPADALEYANVTWETSNSTRLSVNASTGLVTAKKAGQSTITAHANGKRKCYVRVTAYTTAYSGKTYGLEVQSSSYNKIALSWKEIPNADGYVIERSTKKKSGYKQIASVSGSKTAYTDKTCTPGRKYYYRIRAYYEDNGKQYCGYSSKVSGTARVSATKIKTASGKRRITVSWKKVNGADGYAIYRSTKKKSGYRKIAEIKSGSTLKFTNSNLRSGTTYYYKVKAYRKESGKKVYGTYSNVSQKKAK